MKANLVCGFAAAALMNLTSGVYGQPISINDGAPDLRAIAFAAEFLRLGRAAETCTLLDIAAGPDTRNVPALFLYGECHMDQGDMVSAERYFARAMMLEPDSVIVRQRLDEVRAVQAFVLAPEPTRESPTLVAAATTQAAQPQLDPQVAATKTDPRLAGSVSLTRGYDTNINSGTFHSVVDALIGGVTVPLTMTPESMVRGSAFTRLTGEYGVLQPLSNESAGQLVARVEAIMHDDWSEYDKVGLSLSGRYLRLSEGWNLSMGPNLHIALDGNGRHMVSAGASLSGRHTLAEGLDLAGHADWRFELYPHDTSKEATLGSVRVGFSYDLGNDWSLDTSLVGRVTDKVARSQSFTGVGARASVEGPLSEDVKLLASYSISREAYHAAPAAFSQDRVDIEHDLALNLDWRIPAVDGLSVFAQYNYQVNGSTIPIYDTERHVISTGMRFSF